MIPFSLENDQVTNHLQLYGTAPDTPLFVQWELDLLTGRWTFSENFYTLLSVTGNTDPLAALLLQVFPADREKVRQAMQSAGSADIMLPLEYRVQNAGGVRYLRQSGARFTHTGQPVVKGIIQDITAAALNSRLADEDPLQTQQQVQQSLVARAQLAESLNDASIDRVMALNTFLQVVAWNKTNEQLTGIGKKEIMGRYFFEMFPEQLQDSRVTEAIEQALQGRKTFIPTGKDVLGKGYYETYFIPLVSETGTVTGILHIMHDVAHRIRAENELKKLNQSLEQQNREMQRISHELSTFAYIAGHDLKEPLKNVYSFLERVINTDGQQLSHFSRGNLRRSQAAIKKMNLLVDDILALHQVNNNEYSDTVQLNELLAEVTAALKGKITEKQAVIHSGSLPAIPGYRTQLQQLFYHLLDNAIKFQPEGHIPEIAITATTVTLPDAELPRSSPDTAYVQLVFSDNGIGFEQADSEKIFNMFTRLPPAAAYSGSGKGLALCKKIAESHEGAIVAKSTPGKGSSFCCYLPLSPTPR
jgi:PAS domain S-box-containing protein